MYGKILVPVDGSEASALGLSEAIKIAKCVGGQIRLVHFVNEFVLDYAYGSGVYATDVIELLRKGGRSVLERAKAVVQEQGITPECVLLESMGGRAADLIVASASARFSDVYARWGLTPVWGLSLRLPHRVGTAKASEMMLSCRTYSGAEAQAMQLANYCFADDSFDVELARLAQDILANSWYSNQVNKRALMQIDGLSLHDAHSLELFKNEGLAPDAQQRVARYFEKGKPPV